MGRKSKIDWDNIKITFIKADSKDPNPLNPCSRMTAKQRYEEIVEISAKIWQRHVREKLEGQGQGY